MMKLGFDKTLDELAVYLKKDNDDFLAKKLKFDYNTYASAAFDTKDYKTVNIDVLINFIRQLIIINEPNDKRLSLAFAELVERISMMIRENARDKKREDELEQANKAIKQLTRQLAYAIGHCASVEIENQKLKKQNKRLISGIPVALVRGKRAL
jgi:hypothetical protein